ncbi:MAG TPA: hypothetical protein VE996_02175 [Terriglobales bacterium]|nr:hypothetical protein [Terriglobales bacterium]
MAEKVRKLGLERDYRFYLYFIDGDGNVCRQPKGKKPARGEAGARRAEVVVPHAVHRDNEYLYFIDRDGDVARSRRVGRGRRAA